MPSKQPKKRAPKASRKKRASFTFHLLQPFFQFLALIIVMLAFARCSPLSPSVDKASFMEGNNGVGRTALRSEALEQTIQASLKEVSSGEAKIVSESAFRKVTEDVKSADDSLDEAAAKSIFKRRDQTGVLAKKPKILFLNLNPELAASLMRDGKVRINLNERLSASDARAKKALIRAIQKEQLSGQLDANGYLVMPDLVIKRGALDALSVELKVSFGAPSEEESYIEVSHIESGDVDATLLDAALRDLRSLAIVLE
ncbi:MAG: hypothetical protein EOP11_23735 [Proteobacteria bacterium]|nr:MAG: hypothetical protein EOP11_23735 [Pseudomonadota bacterium]